MVADTEWLLDILHPERRRQKFHAFLRDLENYPANNPKVLEVFHKALRRTDDKMLGEIWREWKDGGRGDLALEAEREMERRKAHRR
jgi:hypothetical protein